MAGLGRHGGRQRPQLRLENRLPHGGLHSKGHVIKRAGNLNESLLSINKLDWVLRRPDGVPGSLCSMQSQAIQRVRQA